MSWAVPKASDLPERVRGEIGERLRELRPLVDEYEELLKTIGVLEAEARAAASARVVKRPRNASRSRKASVPRKTSGKTTAPGRGVRPAKGIGETLSAAAKKGERAPRGAAAEAIVAALEHGSHTVSELVVVTAMSAQSIRGNLRRLLQAGAVTRTKREGKTAYALGRPAEKRARTPDR